MKFYSIQYLRAAAAFMVVSYHLANYAKIPGLTADSTDVLGSGVDIFFVISGVVMWMSTAGRPVRLVEFWTARIVRIVPLYWVLTSIVVVMMLIQPSAVRTGRFDLAHIIASYLFIAWPHPTLQLMFPVLIPGWTLNYEMLFYFGFGLLLLFPVRLRLPGLAASFLALASLRLLSPNFGSFLAFYTDPVLLEFVAGACLGRFIMTSAGLPGWSCLALFVTGMILLVVLPEVIGTDQRLLVRGIPAVLIVGSAMVAERAYGMPRFRLPGLLGDASYSIYLVHPIVLVAVAKAWRTFGFDPYAAQATSFASALLVVAVIGILVHRGLEVPLLATLRRFRPRRLEERTAQQVGC